jgi:hypothetical protein
MTKTQLLNHPPTKKNKTKQNTHADSQHQKTKWVNFTYGGKEVRKIKKMFRTCE